MLQFLSVLFLEYDPEIMHLLLIYFNPVDA